MGDRHLVSPVAERLKIALQVPWGDLKVESWPGGSPGRAASTICVRRYSDIARFLGRRARPTLASLRSRESKAFRGDGDRVKKQAGSP
jgi:hypothetical protein